MYFKEINQQLASDITHEAFGDVNVRAVGDKLEVALSMLIEPEPGGWQTGIALDASASMKGMYGRVLDQASIPTEVMTRLIAEGHVNITERDGREAKSFTPGAMPRLREWGVTLRRKPNLVEGEARGLLSYLASKLDADRRTTLVYWACGDDGMQYEVAGDFRHEQCSTVKIEGPVKQVFGEHTCLLPVMRYFVERYKDASKGFFVFVTDGTIDDFDDVKRYSKQIATEIAAGRRALVKFVLIGLGSDVNSEQLVQLDDLNTGTHVDLWDHKLAADITSVLQIFAEIVDDHLRIPGTGSVTSGGRTILSFDNGVPCAMRFQLPATAIDFELTVNAQMIHQPLVLDARQRSVSNSPDIDAPSDTIDSAMAAFNLGKPTVTTGTWASRMGAARVVSVADLAFQRRQKGLKNAEQKIIDEVRAANADGILEPGEAAHLTRLASRYLRMDPTHEKISAMLAKLLQNMEKYADKHAANDWWVSHLTDAQMRSLDQSLVEKLPAAIRNQSPYQANVIDLTGEDVFYSVAGEQFNAGPEEIRQAVQSLHKICDILDKLEDPKRRSEKFGKLAAKQDFQTSFVVEFERAAQKDKANANLIRHLCNVPGIGRHLVNLDEVTEACRVAATIGEHDNHESNRISANYLAALAGIHAETSFGAAIWFLRRSLELDCELQVGTWVELAKLSAKQKDTSYSQSIKFYSEAYAVDFGPNAIESYLKGIEACPDFPWNWNNLACGLAIDPDVRDGQSALRLAQVATELTDSGNANILDTLAAAQAACGMFDEAAATSRRALEICDEDFRTELQHNLARYENRQPWEQYEPPAVEEVKVEATVPSELIEHFESQMYLPPLSLVQCTSFPLDRFHVTLTGYNAIMCAGFPKTNRQIDYEIALLVYSRDDLIASHCFALEKGESVPTGQVAFGMFDAAGHRSLGMQDQIEATQGFIQDCVELSLQLLEPVRSPAEVLDELDSAPEAFHSLLESYHMSLSMVGSENNWNAEIDDYARELECLRESELFRARFDLRQAVLNRIIVRYAHERNQ